jgi:hypothetical protein
MNYSSDPQTFKYPYGAGEELLTQSAVTSLQALTLKPWDLVIIAEK